jgi:hypothetical protein
MVCIKGIESVPVGKLEGRQADELLGVAFVEACAPPAVRVRPARGKEEKQRTWDGRTARDVQWTRNRPCEHSLFSYRSGLLNDGQSRERYTVAQVVAIPLEV